MHVHPSRYTVWASAGFAAGVFIASYAALPAAIPACLFIAGIAACALAIPHRARIALFGIAIAAFALGILRMDHAAARWSADRVQFLAVARMSPITVEGIVVSRERLAASTRYVLEDTQVAVGKDAAPPQPIGTRWGLLSTSGETLAVGTLVRASDVRLDSATTADAFLQRERLAGIASFPKTIAVLGGAWRCVSRCPDLAPLRTQRGKCGTRRVARALCRGYRAGLAGTRRRTR